MSVHQIPAEVMRALLLNVEGPISAACPYAFLLEGGADGDLQPHLDWLAEHELLDAPAEQDGQVAITPALRLTLDILARPVRRILISELDDRGMRRAMHVSDGAQVVIAMFDEQNCLVSDPLDLEAFRDALVSNLGTAKTEAAPDPLQLPPEVLGFMGAVAGPWWSGDGPSQDGAAADGSDYPELRWPIARAEAEARLTALTGDSEFANDIIAGLTADHILTASGKKLDIHTQFKPWHKALSSGNFLEIQRMEVPDSDLTRAQPPVRAYFAGAKGERCLLWPAAAGSAEVLLSRPTAEELKSLIGYLVGYLDPEPPAD